MTWSQRLRRVFGIDIETCPLCGGALQIIACIDDPAVIQKILTHIDSKNTSTAKTLPPNPPCCRPVGRHRRCVGFDRAYHLPPVLHHRRRP